ncbi:MAG: ferritin-like domain-containing protein [Methylobacteriaceae bacterium]|nr:ferritin-like domain-containing protein [Methylobacteriaceae bacterium]
MRQVSGLLKRFTDRRSFLKSSAMAAGVSAMGAGMFPGNSAAQDLDGERISEGDEAILRFLAAAEIIESDLWQQYNELGGVNGGSQPYINALEQLDGDLPQYITDNTDDEISHETFLNAYLVMKGGRPVDLDGFRTLPSSQATGARQIGRLTNLFNLTVDTSWWVRYRSETNPDLGATFPQVVSIVNRPAIPKNNTELNDANHTQALANTAGFHFAFIEQGGTSLYAEMAQKVSSLEVLRIVVSIGGTEIAHFQTWHDKAGNAPPLSDNGLVFPNFNLPPFTNGETVQKNKIMPEPCQFLNPKLPLCSIIRPTDAKDAAKRALAAFTHDGLFIGQTNNEFFEFMQHLADAADAARRRV